MKAERMKEMPNEVVRNGKGDLNSEGRTRGNFREEQAAVRPF